MFRSFKALSAALFAAVLAPVSSAFAAEPTITELQSVGTYSTAAKRVNYSGEMAQFSLDIPAELFPQITDDDTKAVGDGSVQWELFYAEDISPYIDCCFHQSEGGYEEEMSGWRELAEEGESGLEIFTRNDLNGCEFSVVDLHLGYSEENCTEIIIGEFPWGNDTWINISLGGEHSLMDEYREDIYAMFSTFSRAGESFTDAPDEAGKSTPETGVEIPVTAAFTAFGAAAVMAGTRKSKRK